MSVQIFMDCTVCGFEFFKDIKIVTVQKPWTLSRLDWAFWRRLCDQSLGCFLEWESRQEGWGEALWLSFDDGSVRVRWTTVFCGLNASTWKNNEKCREVYIKILICGSICCTIPFFIFTLLKAVHFVGEKLYGFAISTGFEVFSAEKKI